MWQVFFPKEIEEIEYIPLPEPMPIPMKTNQEKLIEIAQNALDTDVSPADLAGDELGCAESVSNLIKEIFPDFSIILGTSLLFSILKKDKRFKATLTPHIGCIVLSPAQGEIHGHTGIFITNDRIASNDSGTGMWKGNYDWNSWVDTFGVRGRGLHTYLFEIIN